MIKVKEIIKLLGMTALSVGILGTSIIGVSNTAFGAETNFPPATTAANAELRATDAEFILPKMTVIRDRRRGRPLPANALTMQQAAQIGMRYIWDVFDADDLDGMYMQMRYNNESSHSNTWWSGYVTATNRPIKNESDPSSPHVLYSFTIDAVTGARIYINHTPVSVYPQPNWRNAADDADLRARRASLREIDWSIMDVSEQIKMAGITKEELERYSETAMELAQRHFNLSTVVDLDVTYIGSFGITTSNNVRTVEISMLGFVATDDTGIKANISIPAEESKWPSISIDAFDNVFNTDAELMIEVAREHIERARTEGKE